MSMVNQKLSGMMKLVSHDGHVDGHMHVDCDDSAGATRYSACGDCNGFLDQVKANVYELQQSAREQGLCAGCGSDWCTGSCDEE
jgi:hypothetical protein